MHDKILRCGLLVVDFFFFFKSEQFEIERELELGLPNFHMSHHSLEAFAAVATLMNPPPTLRGTVWHSCGLWPARDSRKTCLTLLKDRLGRAKLAMVLA